MSSDVLEIEDEPVAVAERAPSQVHFQYTHRIQDLERQRDAWELEKRTFLEHMRDLHYRNDLLQQRLDQAIGENARRQADAMDTTTVATVPMPHSFTAKQDRSKVTVATYRIAMQMIGKPATAQEIATVLSYSRERVYSWLQHTGSRYVKRTVAKQSEFEPRPAVYYAWLDDTKETP